MTAVSVLLLGIGLGLRHATDADHVVVVVSAMLIGIGMWHLLRSPQVDSDVAPLQAGAARPLAIGLVHGLGGSAGVALLAATTIGSRPLAALYLGLVALGTVIGMVALTIVLSRPIAWTMRRPGLLRRSVTGIAALLSIGLGLSVLV